jgi:hypothetical protein
VGDRAEGRPSVVLIGAINLLVTMVGAGAWLALMWSANPIDAAILLWLVIPPVMLGIGTYLLWAVLARRFQPALSGEDRQRVAFLGCGAVGASLALLTACLLWLSFHALGALAGAHGTGGPPKGQLVVVATMGPALWFVLTWITSRAIAARLGGRRTEGSRP